MTLGRYETVSFTPLNMEHILRLTYTSGCPMFI